MAEKLTELFEMFCADVKVYEEMYNKGFEDGKEEALNKIRDMLFGEEECSNE